MPEKSDQVNKGHSKKSGWDYHLDQIEHSDLFSDSEKREVLEGVTKLRQIFDDEWLLDAAKTHHPLFQYYISNHVPWTQFWLADFGRALDSIKGTLNSDDLVKRLKDSKQYSGAKLELQVAWKLKKAGFNIELCCYTHQKGTKKKPDIKCLYKNETIYFEVNGLAPSLESQRAGETFSSLTDFGNYELHQFCQIHKILSKPHRQELSAQIDNAIAEVKRTKEYISIQEPGVIDCLIIHRSKEAELDTILDKLGMKREISGPPYETYDINRLRRNLRDKSQQPPTENPGIVVMYWDFYHSGSDEKFLDKLVYDIEEELYAHDHLIYWIIISSISELGAQNISLRKEKYTFIRKCTGYLCEDILAIRNKYSKFDIDEEILQVFMG
jgi:hypothetical protein